MQTHFIPVWSVSMPTSIPQATHLRFSTNFVKLFTTFEQPWDSSSLCSGFLQVKRQTVSWLQQCFLKSTKDFVSLLDMMIQVNDLRRILNWLASVWPMICFWENMSLRFWWKILKIFIDTSHIYRPLVAFQKLLKRCDFSEYFSKILSLVIDYNFLVMDYTIIFWRVIDFSKLTSEVSPLVIDYIQVVIDYNI